MLFPPSTDSPPPSRVVVTGVGIVTSLGAGWKANEDGLRRGRSAFSLIRRFDVSRHRVKTAAQVDLPLSIPEMLLSARQRARLDRASSVLLLAAKEAWQQSGWDRGDNLPVVLGTTAGGMQLGEEYFRQAVSTPGSHRGQPTRAFQYQAQAQARMLLDALAINGPVTITSNACASGASAIGLAWDQVRRGRAERVLTGGYEVLSEMVFSGFDALQALSPTTCRPFDAGRDGLALGEGAAMLTIESLESARRRGADILCEIAGYGTTIDLHHLTQPHPEGNAAVESMTQACRMAGLVPSDVDYVNAHGTGTTLNDSSEAQAIRCWADGRAATLPVSSTKAGIGHLLGAAGAVEFAACVMALRGQWIPPQANFETPDAACDFPIIHEPRDAKLKVVMSNSFGFGGVNATLIVKRWT